ncbi:MAG TPA: ABC transporter ATP-binding protein [Candidatus Thermoplasmatota archaeon]
MYPPLVVERVTKRFGKVVAVNDVSISLEPGASLGLVGPNGSGKTTLIKCCVGIYKPEAGRILLAGRDLTDGDVEGKRHIAFAPELPDVVDGFTAWDHFTFLARMLEWKNGWRGEAARLLDAFDMADSRDKLAGGFSKGEKQKVMLSMAFLRRPAVLFLDEPLIGLDPKAALALKGEVRSLLAAGGCAVICSHVLSLVEELCGGLAVMSRGRVVVHGSAAGLRVAARSQEGTPLEEAFTKVTEAGHGTEADIE